MLWQFHTVARDSISDISACQASWGKPWRAVPAIPDIFHSPLASLLMQGGIGEAEPAASSASLPEQLLPGGCTLK